MNYLLFTTYGFLGLGDPLLSYVGGSRGNLEGVAPEALFIVISRFLIGFAVSWTPITAIIAAIRR